jgi:hypothetical protein
MPAKLTLLRVATPELLVVAVPFETPFKLKVTVFPATPLPPDVRVAERFVLPPNAPDAEAAAIEVVAITGAEYVAVQLMFPLLPVPITQIVVVVRVSDPEFQLLKALPATVAGATSWTDCDAVAF